MRKAVRQALNSFHGGRLNTLFYDNVYDEKMIQGHADVFKDAGIIEEAKPLLHSVAQIYKKLETES
jgi:prepilin-type processing-associated H-X9-DG protein